MANIQLLISTHQGVLYNEVVDYVVVSSKKGEFAIMKDHVNLITTLEEGFIKLVRGDEKVFVAINDGALMFSNNKLSLICAEASIAKTKERSYELLLEARHERLEQNKKINTELEITERKLKENIKGMKAGNL